MARAAGVRFGDTPSSWIGGRKGVYLDISSLQQLPELVGGQLAISDDLVKQAGAYGLAGVRRHNRTAAILVTHEVVAAFHAKNAKASLFEGGNEVSACDAGSPAHAAMVTRWMPMNSKSCVGAPSTSRHSSIASRMRCVTSSRDRACVWHAGICGTEAT